MNLTKVSALLLGSFLSHYAVRRWQQHVSGGQNTGKSTSFPVQKPEVPVQSVNENAAHQVTDRSIKKALFAYDTSDHKTLMHVRFDRQTVDTLNKFKLATGVDMSKFVAFSVRHLLNTTPEFKTIIQNYLNRTPL
ncbi:hypothetical protein PQ469_24555 [Mucilaginibacter sp. KACC 22773]|uniref:hypothetical protein n=1 Tax=Mucilaginibacter sp. KACC 22773 TaxID=3025671 RepID=UPI00236504A8|nr:hypothetical protein [Mucilaginibacter sp. KACC 22773]WDF77059.1 hypothetical protein PQ469_24555 [Mucilaginibacter sp. KACC 22773]